MIRSVKPLDSWTQASCHWSPPSGRLATVHSCSALEQWSVLEDCLGEVWAWEERQTKLRKENEALWASEWLGQRRVEKWILSWMGLGQQVA